MTTRPLKRPSYASVAEGKLTNCSSNSPAWQCPSTEHESCQLEVLSRVVTSILQRPKSSSDSQNHVSKCAAIVQPVNSGNGESLEASTSAIEKEDAVSIVATPEADVSSLDGRPGKVMPANPSDLEETHEPEWLHATAFGSVIEAEEDVMCASRLAYTSSDSWRRDSCTSHGMNTYESIFESVTNVRLSETHLPAGHDLASTVSSALRNLSHEDVLCMRTRFHCAVYSGSEDTFCDCCEAKSVTRRDVRCQAIEVAARVYQDYVLTFSDERPTYWSALMHSRALLAQHELSIEDVEHELLRVERIMAFIRAQQLEFYRPRTAKMWRSNRGDSIRRSQASVAIRSRFSSHKVSDASHCDDDHNTTLNGSDRSLLTEVVKAHGYPSSNTPDTSADDEDKTNKDSWPMENPCTNKNETLSTMPEVAAERPLVPTPSNTRFVKAKKKKKRNSKCKQKTHEEPISAYYTPDEGKETKVGDRPFLLSSGEMLFFDNVHEIPPEVFLRGQELKQKFEQYYHGGLSIAKAYRMLEDFRSETNWCSDLQARCIEVYIINMLNEVETRKAKVIPWRELRSQVLHGSNNERTRLSLGQITPEEHVKNALEVDRFPRSERINRVKTSLNALFDFTLQQFWHHYHLVPEDRIQQLDRLKKKLNSLGGKFPLPSYTRKLGEGFTEIFANLQEEHVQNARAHQHGVMHFMAENSIDLREHEDVLRTAYDNIVVYGKEEYRKSGGLLSLLKQREESSRGGDGSGALTNTPSDSVLSFYSSGSEGDDLDDWQRSWDT